MARALVKTIVFPCTGEQTVKQRRLGVRRRYQAARSPRTATRSSGRTATGARRRPAMGTAPAATRRSRGRGTRVGIPAGPMSVLPLLPSEPSRGTPGSDAGCRPTPRRSSEAREQHEAKQRSRAGPWGELAECGDDALEVESGSAPARIRQPGTRLGNAPCPAARNSGSTLRRERATVSRATAPRTNSGSASP